MAGTRGEPVGKKSLFQRALAAWHGGLDEEGEPIHHETAPEDRISLLGKILYGAGAFVNNLLAAAIGGMTIVLNLALGMNPALVGLL